MAMFFDHDPETGVTEYFDYDPLDDTFSIVSQQDVTQFLDHMQKLRNNPELWANGVKENFAYYCSIPPVVEMELNKKGLSIYNRHQTKEILKEINSNYPHLRATDKWHR